MAFRRTDLIISGRIIDAAADKKRRRIKYSHHNIIKKLRRGLGSSDWFIRIDQQEKARPGDHSFKILLPGLSNIISHRRRKKELELSWLGKQAVIKDHFSIDGPL